MQVLGDRVFVEIVKAGLETRNGLIIPEKNNGLLEKGIVFAVGTDCIQVKEGDTVYLEWHAGRPANYEGKEYIVIREHDISHIIEE